jgi:hypothetical protein
MVREWTKQNGKDHGFEHAELFHVIGTMEARREG